MNFLLFAEMSKCENMANIWIESPFGEVPPSPPIFGVPWRSGGGQEEVKRGQEGSGGGQEGVTRILLQQLLTDNYTCCHPSNCYPWLHPTFGLPEVSLEWKTLCVSILRKTYVWGKACPERSKKTPGKSMQNLPKNLPEAPSEYPKTVESSFQTL